MTIAALPHETVHLLRSAQALTTPTSLVKELIDNSLDARATSIDVLVSPNTIDRIEVRDNGHGIRQEDLNVLGKHAHTSKLRSFNELKSIGGISLGFRGEALASAVQLGEVSVTTKTEGEPTATTVILKAGGGIASQTRTSHPVGTSVFVAKFLEKLPVRKQTAVKGATKTLARIKSLLQAYALARPLVKFNLKVTKNGKGSWAFVPRAKDSVREAASQVIGRDAAVQCIEKSLIFSQNDYIECRLFDEDDDHSLIKHGDTQVQGDVFVVDLLLPKPDADSIHIGHGQYISIDSRPVSHEKGTMKKIVSVFKYYVKNVLLENSEKLKTPFLRMNIRCPLGSYDANVEPAKDDVIFENEPLLLGSIEQLFKDIYGERKTTPSEAPPKDLYKQLDNFELLMARKDTALSTEEARSSPQPEVSQKDGRRSRTPENSADLIVRQVNDIASNNSTYVEERFSSRKRKWVVDVSEDFDEDIRDPQQSNHASVYPTPRPELTPLSDMQMGSRNSLNPWIIAKMITSVQPTNNHSPAATEDIYNDDSISQEVLLTPRHSLDPAPPEVGDNEISVQRAVPQQKYHNAETAIFFIPPASHDDQQQAGPGHQTQVMRGSSVVEDGLQVGDDSETFRRRNVFCAKHVPEPLPLPLPTIQATNASQKTRDITKPYASPTVSSWRGVVGVGLQQTRLMAKHQLPGAQNGNQGNIMQEEANPELTWAMEFEHRKEDATRRRREETRRSQQAVDQSISSGISKISPHKNRYNAAIAALEMDPKSFQDQYSASRRHKTTLRDSDPRAYLMKRQWSMLAQGSKSGEGSKLTRAKSLKLPLESIPEGQALYTLTFSVSTNMGTMADITRKMAKVDSYIDRGNQVAGLVVNPRETIAVIDSVRNVVKEWLSSQREGKLEVKYMFENLLPVVD